MLLFRCPVKRKESIPDLFFCLKMNCISKSVDPEYKINMSDSFEASVTRGKPLSYIQSEDDCKTVIKQLFKICLLCQELSQNGTIENHGM